MNYSYGKLELEHLQSRDSRLASVIDRFGVLEIPVEPDLFTGIVNHIVSQQISWQAAQTVWRRFVDQFSPVQASLLAHIEPAAIQSVGLSWRKVDYIQRIARMIDAGELPIGSMTSLPDAQVRSRLLALPGIGDWTVDMLMIFSLQRPDIMSWHDLAIRRGLMRLHQLETMDRALFRTYQELYAPFGTIASFYLWEIAHE